MKIKLIKDNEKGKTYQTDNFKILYRYKGVIIGDNSKNVEELIYLITGSAEVTLKDSTVIVQAPAKIEFPAKTYHKIKAFEVGFNVTNRCFRKNLLQNLELLEPDGYARYSYKLSEKYQVVPSSIRPWQ